MSFTEIPEESERIPSRPAAWTLGLTVLVIAACAVVVWSLDAFHLAGGGRSDVRQIESLPPAQPFSEIGRLEQTRGEQARRLDLWTWADRDHRRVRLPVGVAIDRYLEQRGVH